tara:strand:+ start:434 stop:649 length:216 start_codon:yes stop_codon:yes gene_type:complete
VLTTKPVAIKLEFTLKIETANKNKDKKEKINVFLEGLSSFKNSNFEINNSVNKVNKILDAVLNSNEFSKKY